MTRILHSLSKYPSNGDETMALRDFCHLDLIPYSNGEFHQYVDESMDSSSSEARSGAQVLSMVSL